MHNYKNFRQAITVETQANMINKLFHHYQKDKENSQPPKDTM